jgi:hypothetical protein
LGTYFELVFMGVLVLAGTVIVLEVVVLLGVCGLLLPLPLETFVEAFLDVWFLWL